MLGVLLGLLGLLVVPVAPAAAADVDHFSFDSMHGDYVVTRAEDGSLRLDVTETLVPVFPETDQNRGIVRRLPVSDNGVRLNPEVHSVRDADGNDVPYEVETTANEVKVSIGTDEFVHGRQTYVIEYTAGNAVRPDQGGQAFAWDVNGTGWAQMFREVSATVHIDKALQSAMTDAACYAAEQGGGADSCTPETSDGTVSARAEDVAPGQTLTIQQGFREGTFRIPVSPAVRPGLQLIPAGLLLAGVGGCLWMLIWRRRHWCDAPGWPVIVPEYEPPAGVDLLLAGNVADAAGRAPVAALIDLAVRDQVAIIDAGGGSFAVELRTTDEQRAATLSDAERGLVQAIFGPQPQPGQQVLLAAPDEARGQAIGALVGQQQRRAIELGLRRKVQGHPPVIALLLVLAGCGGSAFAGAVYTVWTGQHMNRGWIFLGLPVMVWGLVLEFLRPTRLTHAGAVLRDTIRGNRMYIEWAEKDRLRFLQSTFGAERLRTDRALVVRLYERMLPMAVLLGQERSWNEALNRAFAEVGGAPSWYVSANPAGFAGINTILLTSTMSSAFSGPVSSSTVGGGPLGGFAGGGFGGGGGSGR